MDKTETLSTEKQDFFHKFVVENFVERSEELIKDKSKRCLTSNIFNIKRSLGKNSNIIEAPLILDLSLNLGEIINLSIVNSSQSKMSINYDIGFYNLEKEDCLILPTVQESFVSMNKGVAWHWEPGKCNKILSFFTTNNPELISSEGSVTAFVRVTVKYDILTTESSFQDDDEEEGPYDISRGLEQTHLADVILKCEDLEIPCHKIILAMISEVFQAMFKKKNFVEAKEKMVEIKNTDPETLKAFVDLIYGEKINNLSLKAKKLFALSDQYDVQYVANKCSNYLQQNMQVEDAAEILLLGDLHNEEVLKSKALNFILNNYQTVCKTEGWKLIGKNHSRLLEDVLYAMSNKF